MERSNITSGSPFEESIGFSRAVRQGPNLYISGTAPISSGNATAFPGDAYGQTKTCLEIMKKAIEKAGGQWVNVVRTRIYLKEASDWELAARAHREMFAQIRPASTFVVVKGFINPDWLVETEADCFMGSS